MFALVLLVAWLPLETSIGEIARADAGQIALAILSGVVQYALAFWFYLIGLSRFKASTAALFLTLIPVFGLSGAALVLGEAIQVSQVVGALIIVVAIASARRAFAS